MVLLRKERAGSCNLGYDWPTDGAEVEVTPEHARLLLAVPDGGYSVAAPSGSPKSTEDADRTIEEPAAEAPISEAPAPRKTAAKRTAAKKAAEAQEQSVEE